MLIRQCFPRATHMQVTQFTLRVEAKPELTRDFDSDRAFGPDRGRFCCYKLIL